MAAVALPMNRALSLELTLNRLLWPVPLVRWRAARVVRDLIENPATRATSTDALLAALRSAELESDVCAVLTVLLMVEKASLPELEDVRSHILQHSILADILLHEIYGSSGGTDWRHAHSGTAPLSFEESEYFTRYRTQHVPPQLLNSLVNVEEATGLPFTRQWGFEWQQLCDRTGAQYTEFPYYFCDFGEMRDGVVGQFSPRQSELYRSAYLRTFAIAVSEWGFPQREAGPYVSEVSPSIRGLFEVDPVERPAWLSDFPERCAAEPDDLEALLRAMVANRPADGRALVSLHAPLDGTVERFGDVTLTSYLVSADFVAPARHPAMPTAVLMAHTGLTIDQPLCATMPDEVRVEGLHGDALPVCSSLLPLPHGLWHGHLHSTGIPMPNSFVAPGHTFIQADRNRLSLRQEDVEISTTRYWLDHWSPNYPLSGGSTRCGAWAIMDQALLMAYASMTGRQLAWSARLRIWRREKDYGPFELVERTLFLTAQASGAAQ